MSKSARVLPNQRPIFAVDQALDALADRFGYGALDRPRFFLLARAAFRAKNSSRIADKGSWPLTSHEGQDAMMKTCSSRRCMSDPIFIGGGVLAGPRARARSVRTVRPQQHFPTMRPSEAYDARR